MKKIVFIVEGDSENEFVNRLIRPHLVSKGIPNHHIQSVMITMSGGGHGFNNIEHLRNTIKPVLHRSDQPIVTTFVDHYRLNSEKKLPGYTECTKETDVEKRLTKMEEKLQEAIQSIYAYRYFIPYIQRHEFETLLFADPTQGFDLEDESIKQEVIDLCSQYSSIEDINTTPQGAPSVRLGEIYRKNKKSYNKGVDAVDIAELTTMEKILEKCPRFSNWINKLISEIQKS